MTRATITDPLNRVASIMRSITPTISTDRHPLVGGRAAAVPSYVPPGPPPTGGPSSTPAVEDVASNSTT